MVIYTDSDTHRLIYKAISIYNKYRSPEALASLMSIDSNKVVIEFKGSFCHTCGVRDWIEDFKYILIDLGLDNELVEVIEKEEFSRIGIFKIKKNGDRID